MRLGACVLVILAAGVLLGAILSFEATSDLPAFLRGAEEILRGNTPYGPTGSDVHTWLYAPWLAAVFVPFLAVRPELAAALWHLLLALALIACVVPMLRTRSLEGSLGAVLIGVFGFHAVWAGHFEPLMIAVLVHGLPTRWGPVAIGVAASIKITPIVLCLRYAGRGEWKSVAVAVFVAITLWAPALLFDTHGWGLPIGHTLSLLGYTPIAWLAAAVAATVGAWALAPTRYGWLAAAVAWIAVMPRLLPYDVLGLAAGAAPISDSQRVPARSSQPLPRERYLGWLAAIVTPTLGRGRRIWALRSAGPGEQYRDLVLVDLAPAGILSGAGDEGGFGRQEDRIGAVGVQE